MESREREDGEQREREDGEQRERERMESREREDGEQRERGWRAERERGWRAERERCKGPKSFAVAYASFQHEDAPSLYKKQGGDKRVLLYLYFVMFAYIFT